MIQNKEKLAEEIFAEIFPAIQNRYLEYHESREVVYQALYPKILKALNETDYHEFQEFWKRVAM